MNFYRHHLVVRTARKSDRVLPVKINLVMISGLLLPPPTKHFRRLETVLIYRCRTKPSGLPVRITNNIMCIPLAEKRLNIGRLVSLENWGIKHRDT